MTNISEKPIRISKEEKNGITQELLHEYFYYKDGFLYWKKVDYQLSRIKIGDRAGYIAIHKNDSRYVIGIKNGIQYFASRLIFLYHYGYLPIQVDHINNNSLDDHIENLRHATQSLNNKNKSSHRNSTSGYKGVSLCKRDQNWKVQICINGKNTFLGRFETEEIAALAYNEAAKKHYGEFANLNIIE